MDVLLKSIRLVFLAGLWAIVVIAVGGTLYGLVAEFLWHAMDIHIPRIADILARLQDYLP